MNHDIIAAGHPALYFDMAIYHEVLPKHWRDPDQHQENFRAQLWLAGQIASADAELELLESRACKSLPVSTWPELSNYRCNSCHIAINGMPKPAKWTDRYLVTSGRAPVRSWNLSGLSSLSGILDAHASDVLVSENELGDLLKAPNPDPERVAAASKKIREQLHKALYHDGRLTLPGWSRRKQTELAIGRLEDARRINNWEAAAGAYTAAWATYPMRAIGNLDSAMETMRNGLLFPKNLMMPDFPRSQSAATPPTLEEWNDSLQEVVAILKMEDRK
jgi:hypothetical protein